MWIPVLILSIPGLLFTGFGVEGVDVMVNISETDLPGTEVLALADHSGCNVTSEYFNITEPPSSKLVLNRSLDLEAMENADTGTFTTSIVCTDSTINLYIDITPVNEFYPTFNGAPFTSSIAENVEAGEKLFKFKLGPEHGVVSDLDAVKYGNIVAFQIHTFQIIQFDGSSSFDLDQRTGEITSRFMFDYDVLPRKYFILNVSATDDGGFSSYASVNISITDVDDTPPIFLRPGCYNNDECQVEEYSAVIDVEFQGVVELDPGIILAQDGDRGIRVPVQYSIQSQDDADNLTSKLQIDDITGNITVLTPYKHLTNLSEDDVIILNFTITATENSTLKRSSNSTLTLFIYRYYPSSPKPTTTMPIVTDMTSHTETTSTTKQPEDDNDVAILVVEIGVSAVVVIIIVVVVIIVLVKMKCKKERESIYDVKENERTRDPNLNENRISTLSSTPINPYELLSVYAKMPLTSNENVKTDNNQNVADQKLQTDQHYASLSSVTSGDGASSGNNTEYTQQESDVHPSTLYAIVDKRKTRKRAVAGQEVENVDENDANDADAMTTHNYPFADDDVKDVYDDVSMEDVTLY